MRRIRARSCPSATRAPSARGAAHVGLETLAAPEVLASEARADELGAKGSRIWPTNVPGIGVAVP
jgi:hypothetical protein